ncbi:MAG: NAD(P)H-dependent oxidoreductase [Burkholderiales bacterium]
MIQGHPDARGNHFAHALAGAYAEAAREAGHEIEVIDVARLDYPVLRTREDWEGGSVPESLRQAQSLIQWAEHIVIFFPLWMGTMPALLKAFFEQVFRPGFAIEKSEGPGIWKELLIRRSARLVVTMGMPAFIYRWYFGAHGVRGLERSVLRFCGIAPIAKTLIGLVDGSPARRQKWLRKLRQLGHTGR